MDRETVVYRTLDLRSTLFTMPPPLARCLEEPHLASGTLTPWKWLRGSNEVDFLAREVTVGGKSGAGKSSFVNKLLGRQIFATDDVEGCTRKVQSIFLQWSEVQAKDVPFCRTRKCRPRLPTGVLITDLPGLGESPIHAASYGFVHRERLEKSDCFLYLLKADDRAYEIDLAALGGIAEAARARLLLGISQADRAEPWREWISGDSQGYPSPRQSETLRKKRKEVSKIFNVDRKRILVFSAGCNFGLPTLLMKLLTAALLGQ